MKILQKLILPFLFLIVIYFIYSIYFAPNDELGLFSNFDTNNNANKEIKVVINEKKNIENDVPAGASTFYALDKNGIEVLVNGPILPPDINISDPVILKGHLHQDHFHSVEISQ